MQIAINKRWRSYHTLWNRTRPCRKTENGYLSSLVTYCKKVREAFPDKIIVAGNVATREMVEELLINDWESVYDLGIVKGTTNWQLFGSRKIKHERYWLTGYYQAVYNTSDNDFEIEDNQVDSFNITKNLEKLSIRYKEHPTFPVKASMMNLLNTIQPKTHKKITTKKMCEIPIRYKARSYGETQISRFSHGFMLIKMVIFAFFKIKAI